MGWPNTMSQLGLLSVLGFGLSWAAIKILGKAVDKGTDAALNVVAEKMKPPPYKARLVARNSGNPPRDVLEIATNGASLDDISTVEWNGEKWRAVAAIGNVVGPTRNIHFAAGRRETTCTVTTTKGAVYTLKIAVA